MDWLTERRCVGSRAEIPAAACAASRGLAAGGAPNACTVAGGSCVVLRDGFYLLSGAGRCWHAGPARDGCHRWYCGWLLDCALAPAAMPSAAHALSCPHVPPLPHAGVALCAGLLIMLMLRRVLPRLEAAPLAAWHARPAVKRE